MKPTREQLIGWSGAVVLCLLLLLVLSLIYLRTVKQSELEGIPVNFGTMEEAFGFEEPAPADQPDAVPETPVEPQTKPVKTKPEALPPVITQNVEQTAAIKAAKERERQERERLAAEQRRKEEEQRKVAEAQRLVAEALSGKGNANSSEGTASSGAGNQGSTQGNAATGSYTGAGGEGSFDLAGRSLRGSGLQRPNYNIQEEGTIVVAITVNAQGDVIAADISLRGTNIDNPNLRKAAIDAAKRTKFNAISGSQNQQGTITYRYKLR
ncbi:MAG: TonB family protein [Candidatus Symbiothrix sp.]|jgi:TonB family protein|nr:TonB family protein [Candidatus Symbiothrix sp.]